MALRKENVRVAAARVAAGQGTSPLLGVCLYTRESRWHARLTHQGIHIHLGFYDREEDAGHAVDDALVNIFDRPDDVNYTPAGERTGNDPRRHQLAHLVGNSKRASTYEGVGKHRDGFRANLRIPLCLLDNKGKEILSLPLPVCPTVTAGGVCACGTKQKFYPKMATEIEAAKFYDSMVRRYGLDQPPHNKPTHFPIV